jgi:hypothetical protein
MAKVPEPRRDTGCALLVLAAALLPLIAVLLR